MSRYEDCVCGERECFACAVGFVIANLGFSPGCNCLLGNRRPCRNECQLMFANWQRAFELSASPYRETAKRLARKVGTVVDRALLVKEGQQNMDVTTEVLAGRSHWSEGHISMRWKQDRDLAALQLSKEIESDPVSFDAAKFFVATIIREGGVVPISLREWTAGILTGKIERPKARGKLKGATIPRDKLIVELLLELLDSFALKPTASDRNNGLSACHAVAEGFRLLGLIPSSYETIVKIWEDRKSLNYLSSSDDW